MATRTPEELIAILRAEVTPDAALLEEAAAALTEAQGWKCFHCGEIFTTRGAAQDHFGATPESRAGCLIDRVALEEGGKPERGRGLLMALRKAESALTEARVPIEIEDALHAIFTTHGIASRSDYQRLVTELISWAAKACRQSQARELTESRQESAARKVQIEALEQDVMLLSGQLAEARQERDRLAKENEMLRRPAQVDDIAFGFAVAAEAERDRKQKKRRLMDRLREALKTIKANRASHEAGELCRLRTCSVCHEMVGWADSSIEPPICEDCVIEAALSGGDHEGKTQNG